MFKGQLISIHIASSAGAAMRSLDFVEAIAGRGLRGDRYFEGVGHWSSSSGVSRDITLEGVVSGARAPGGVAVRSRDERDDSRGRHDRAGLRPTA